MASGGAELLRSGSRIRLARCVAHGSQVALKERQGEHQTREVEL